MEIDTLKVATDMNLVFPILNETRRELQATSDIPRNDWFVHRDNYYCGQWVRNLHESHKETRGQ